MIHIFFHIPNTIAFFPFLSKKSQVIDNDTHIIRFMYYAKVAFYNSTPAFLTLFIG